MPDTGRPALALLAGRLAAALGTVLEEIQTKAEARPEASTILIRIAAALARLNK